MLDTPLERAWCYQDGVLWACVACRSVVCIKVLMFRYFFTRRGVACFKVKNDHRSRFSNLSNWKEEAWKNQGFNGIRTRDLRDTGIPVFESRWSLDFFRLLLSNCLNCSSNIWIISYILHIISLVLSHASSPRGLVWCWVLTVNKINLALHKLSPSCHFRSMFIFIWETSDTNWSIWQVI